MAETKATATDGAATESQKGSPKFSVWYLGSMSMDRLYSQTMQPWVMAEIRRKRENIQEVVIEVVGETLQVSKVNNNDQEDRAFLFEHHLKGLTRFAKLHQDPRCFAYLTRYQLNADFECHVYLANAEEMIPQLFRSIREASKDIHNKPAPGGDTTTSTAQSPPVGSHTQPQPTTTTTMGEGGDAPDEGKSMFEVKFLGRANVVSRRVTADYIDGLAEKMIAREEDMIMRRLVERDEERKKEEEEAKEERRQRHASGASVKSLPDTLDDVADELFMENKLEEQKEMMKQGRRVTALSAEAAGSITSADGTGTDSSSENFHLSESTSSFKSASGALGVGESGGPISLHVDFHSDSDSSRDNLSTTDDSCQGSGQLDNLQDPQPRKLVPISPLVGGVQRRRHSSQQEEGPKIGIHKPGQERDRFRASSFDSLDSETNICRKQGASRIMVLQIGQHSLALISLDKKAAMMESNFKDISFVSQGSHKQDLFGIVVRETGSTFICYILKCLTESVVAEIMSTLQTAFTAAYSKRANTAAAANTATGGATTATTAGAGGGGAVSTSQVCTMCPLHQLHRLCQEIHALSPQAAHDLLVKKVHSLPDKELNEINHTMQTEAPESFEESVEVIMICLRQLCERRQRDHVHISDGNKTAKPDINFLEEKQKLFEGLKNKAKKSLTTSFENLLSRGKKREDTRDGFRQRSWTTDSEASWQSRDSSNTSTPEASPMPSPMNKDFHHEFPSPPHSPGPHRQRSATLDSPGSSCQSERQQTRRRDVNHNKTTSPMKTMYLLATNSPQQSDSMSTSVVNSPMDDPSLLLSPRRPSGSWRKAIFNRVCTPQHSLDFGDEETRAEESQGKHNTAEIRALWKKAILESLLLIRMEKENHNIRARQEEGGATLSRKLEYQELTPCLKEITSVWEQMLAIHDTTEDGEGEEGEDGGPVVDHETKTIPNARLLEYVKKGVPRTLRGQIWLFLMQQRQMSSTVPDSACQPANYEDLLKQLTTHQHAILIDLGRTFPSHPYFSKALGPGQLELFNLLKAYSLLDTEVGYCQGLSFIVGMLLMHMEEISAFHVLKYMMYDLGLRKQFRPNMMALQIKLYQLTRLLHDHYRDVYEHFENHEISPTLYAAPWFLTLFASQFPLGFVARVFDMIFVQGIDSLFKVALMLIGNHRALILQCDTFETIVDFLKTTLPEMVQVQMERIINQAFDLDITKELQAYEVEYHVLSEEMTYSPPQHHQQQQQHHHPHPHHHHVHHHSKSRSPSGGHRAAERPSQLVERRRSSLDMEMLYRMEHQNRALKTQNMELLEKLQHAQSQQRSLELSVHTHQIEQDKLKSHLRALELERAALLTAVVKLRKLVSPEALQNLNLDLSLPATPLDSPLASPQLIHKSLTVPMSETGSSDQRSAAFSGTGDRAQTNPQINSATFSSSAGPAVLTNSCAETTANCAFSTTHVTSSQQRKGVDPTSRTLNFSDGQLSGQSRDVSGANCGLSDSGAGDRGKTIPGPNLDPSSVTAATASSTATLPSSSSSYKQTSSNTVKKPSDPATSSSQGSRHKFPPSSVDVQLPSSSVDTSTAVKPQSLSMSPSSGARTVYPPRSISNAASNNPSLGVLTPEERRKAVKVMVQQSPSKPRPTTDR